MWLDDLVKLDRVGKRCPTIRSRTLLCIDTSLPLEVAGLRYGAGRRASSRAAERRDPSQPDIVRAWPLYMQDYTIRSYVTETGQIVDIALTLQHPPDAPSGLLLWALGVDHAASQRPIFPSRGQISEVFADQVSIRERQRR